MAIELQPEVLTARVRLLSATVDEVEALRNQAWTDRNKHSEGWSDLTTINRMAAPVAERMYALGMGLTYLLQDLETLARSLEDSAALLGNVDDATAEMLEKTREQLSDMELGNFD
ncbi:MAG: hypothetical protein ACTHYM_12970 [Actinomycetaceae bacterium]